MFSVWQFEGCVSVCVDDVGFFLSCCTEELVLLHVNRVMLFWFALMTWTPFQMEARTLPFEMIVAWQMTLASTR